MGTSIGPSTALGGSRCSGRSRAGGTALGPGSARSVAALEQPTNSRSEEHSARLPMVGMPRLARCDRRRRRLTMASRGSKGRKEASRHRFDNGASSQEHGRCGAVAGQPPFTTSIRKSQRRARRRRRSMSARFRRCQAASVRVQAFGPRVRENPSTRPLSGPMDHPGRPLRQPRRHRQEIFVESWRVAILTW